MLNKTKEKRNFKRYKTQADFELNFNAKTYKCKLLDYSDGINAIIYGSPPITIDSCLDIRISEPMIEFEGEVVWVKKYLSETQVRVKRISSLHGSLKDFRLADILIGLQRSTRTGVLEIKNNSIVKRAYIENGDIVSASSNQAVDKLGNILLKAGKINRKQYHQCVQVAKEKKKKEGTILVELGYVTADELILAVKEQMEQILLSLFTFERGTFEFKESHLTTGKTIKLNVSAANLIYRGIKRMEKVHYTPQELDSMDAILSLSSDPLDLFQYITFDKTDKMLLMYIDGKRSIKNIFSHSPLNDFETSKIICALLSIGIIKIKENEDREPQEVTPDEIISKPNVESNEEFIKEVDEMYHKCETREYYRILGVTQQDSALYIKKTYYKIAKKFHPDKHFSIQSKELKEKLNEIFYYIIEAHTVLSDPEKRKEYDRSLSSNSDREYLNADKAKALYNEGMSEMWCHNFPEAARLFAQAVSLDGSEKTYHYYHGRTLCKLKKYKEALSAINTALSFDPLNSSYIAERGYIYLELGLTAKAKDAFEKALKLSPSNKRAIEGMKEIDVSVENRKKNESQSQSLRFFSSLLGRH